MALHVRSLRALLIHKGVIPGTRWGCRRHRLRALLIHKGVKRDVWKNGLRSGLRALLIRKGVKLKGGLSRGYTGFESFVNS